MDQARHPLWALLVFVACGPDSEGDAAPATTGAATSASDSSTTSDAGDVSSSESSGTTSSGGGDESSGVADPSSSSDETGSDAHPPCMMPPSGSFDLGGSFGETTFDIETHLPDQSGLGTYNDNTSTSLDANLLFWCTTWDRLGGRPASSVCFPASECGGDDGERDALHTPWGDTTSPIHSNITLMKWVTAKNAWFARTDCTSGSDCPHADSWQGWGGGGRVCPANWYVVQDSVFKNSDSGQQMHLTSWADGEDESTPTTCDLQAFVLQNVEFAQDPDFVAACEARRDAVDAFVTEDANPNATRDCTKIHAQVPVRVEPEADAWTIWLIHVIGDLRAGSSSECVTNRIVRIGVDASQTDGIYVCSDEQYHDYPDIESALAAGEVQPPALTLSCAGWTTPPPGCTSERGDQD